MAILIAPVSLREDVGAWFTGRDNDETARAVGPAGNLSHRRPHAPAELAAARRQVADRIGYPASSWHLMKQVHGAEVAVVSSATPPGAELRDVDGAVTAELGRPLVVQAADCVPVLLAGPTGVGVAHAGRAGTHRRVVTAVADALDALGSPASSLRVAIGPAIGGCCYEVPASLQQQIVADVPAALATTTWGSPSLDLPAAIAEELHELGVADVASVGACTRCDGQQRWFSHRADPGAGRQVGIVVRREPSRMDPS